MEQEIIALGEGLQILDDAKRAGMRVAVTVRNKGMGKDASQKWQIPEDEMKNKVMEGFLEFKKKAGKSPMFQEKAALKYFLDGFSQAFED